MMSNKILSLLLVFMMTPSVYLLFFSCLSIRIEISYQYSDAARYQCISKDNEPKKWKVIYQNCLASTGHLVQNEYVFINDLLSYPMTYYDRLGKPITDKIRDRICSASKDNIKDVINCPGTSLDSELAITDSIQGCQIRALADRNLSLTEIKDRICGFSDAKHDNQNSSVDGFDCYRNINDRDQRFYQDFFDCQVNKVVTDYKPIIRDTERFAVIISAIDDYCNPAETSNGGDHFDGDKKELAGKDIDAFQNNASVVKCLKSKIKIDKIEDICCYQPRGEGDLEDKLVFECKKEIYRTLPSSDEITTLSDAIKSCIDNQPYVTLENSEVLQDTVRRLEDRRYQVTKPHETMCLSDDPIMIDKYFKCFDYKGSYSHRADYFSCVNQLKIDALKKQRLSCYRGNVYLDRLDLGDKEIEGKITECIKLKYPDGCTIRIYEEGNGVDFENTTKCQVEITGIQKVISKKDAYKKLLNQTKDLDNKKFCNFRYLHHVSNFSGNFKSASDCFATPPTASDAKLKTCYDNAFKSLLLNYESDYILCDLYSGTTNKVSNSV